MSIFDGLDAVPLAPSWRCPHCRTLQPETSRCRSCLRATVTCSSCHRFRRAIGGELGYCAADDRRSPLRGDEVRSCWEARPAPSRSTGLFDETDLTPTGPTATDPPARVDSGTSGAQPQADEATSRSRAAAHDDDRGDVAEAAARHAQGRLVEAPHVAPGRGSMPMPGRPHERGG